MLRGWEWCINYKWFCSRRSLFSCFLVPCPAFCLKLSALESLGRWSNRKLNVVYSSVFYSFCCWEQEKWGLFPARYFQHVRACACAALLWGRALGSLSNVTRNCLPTYFLNPPWVLLSLLLLPHLMFRMWDAFEWTMIEQVLCWLLTKPFCRKVAFYICRAWTSFLDSKTWPRKVSFYHDLSLQRIIWLEFWGWVVAWGVSVTSQRVRSFVYFCILEGDCFKIILIGIVWR